MVVFLLSLSAAWSRPTPFPGFVTLLQRGLTTQHAWWSPPTSKLMWSIHDFETRDPTSHPLLCSWKDITDRPLLARSVVSFHHDAWHLDFLSSCSQMFHSGVGRRRPAPRPRGKAQAGARAERMGRRFPCVYQWRDMRD
ncbi:hypothetical protein QBC47DRAFT_380777 [Echria macrotheca]|uniref:Uncharacterized protein n=1 Tax=Echria macrotheca TaxID=438768 RepID=A0AAJ0BEG3_9PEZI|nr:hypothetical protein QBC47DRAFT_380777 [Echria macrotheca]